MAMLWARPMPVSSIPPHHTGAPRDRQNSSICFACAYPPTRPSLMLMIRQAPMPRAASAWSGLWMHSSRQIGVFRRSEEHTSELQSRLHLVCRLLLEKIKKDLSHCEWRSFALTYSVGASWFKLFLSAFFWSDWAAV